MKKITRRSFLSVCGAAAAAAALTACGGAASSTAASSAAASSTAASASSTAALSGNVATGGSTSMKNVIAALTEGFAELEPDVTISYDPTGSGAGITGATDKTLDIGLSSRALKADETGVTGTIVALDGIAIVVNKASKVADLTVDQLKQMFTGEITNDAKNPVTGVYLNEMQASKMDWYIQRKSTVKRTGDNTYHVTYSFTNTLQPGEAGSLPEYITANAKGGVAVNRVVIYTPAGGEVSNVSASNGSSFAQVQAKDHMTYMDDISLAPQDTVTIEYDVTTAAGSANLKLDQTPTIGDPAITYEY